MGTRRILVLGAVIVTVAGAVALRFAGPAPQPSETRGLSQSPSEPASPAVSPLAESPALTARRSPARVSTWRSQEVFRPSLSADGRMMAFLSRANPRRPAVFVRDNQTGTITRVSAGIGGAAANGPSDHPVVSADGKAVAFLSEASNLVRGDTNGETDVFVRDLVAKTTRRVAPVGGTPGATHHRPHVALSRDGTRVALVSLKRLTADDENDHEDVYLFDLVAGTRELVSISSLGRAGSGQSHTPALSAAGDVVAFISRAPDLAAGDAGESADCFVRDVVARRTVLCSVDESGNQYPDPDGRGPSTVAISGDGRVVAYSWELRFVHLFDRSTGKGLARRDTHRVALDWLALDHAGRRVAHIAVDIAASYAETWETAAGTPPAYVRGTAGPGSQISLSGNGDVVAFSFVDHSRGRDRPVTGIAICRASRGSCARFPE